MEGVATDCRPQRVEVTVQKLQVCHRDVRHDHCSSNRMLRVRNGFARFVEVKRQRL